jgi:glycine cleavage system H protein
MSSIPDDLQYSASHEWVRDEGDGIVAIGITDYAQSALGDIVYVELPQPGATIGTGEVIGVVESVKAASDLYSPVAGEVVETNNELETGPERVNEDAYGAWLLRIRLSEDPKDLLDALAYAAEIPS